MRILSILGMSLLLSSCYLTTSPKKRVAKGVAEVSSEYQHELRSQLNPNNDKELELTWGSALEKMYMQNPRLLQADFRVEDVLAQKKQVFTRFMPILSAGVSDSFTVDTLDQAFSDSNLRIYSYIPLDELVRLPKQVYTNKLLYMSAQLNAEQNMRQEVIALYRLFQKQHLLELERQFIEVEGEIVAGLVQGLADAEEDAEVLVMQDSYLKSREDWQEKYEKWRVEVGDFFMDDYAKIALFYQTLPEITYKPTELDFTDSGRWGMLQLNLLAMEKIAKDARILDLYLQYFPRANFSVSAPPIYSESSSSSFAVDDIRIGPSLSWSLDTRGVIGNQLKRIRREQPLEDWRQDKRTREEVKKLLDGKEALLEVQSELARSREATEGYRKAVRMGLVKDPRRAIETMRKLRKKEVALAAKEIEICTAFWLIDERRWTATTKRWQETRKIRAQKRKEERKRKTKMEKEQKKRARS